MERQVQWWVPYEGADQEDKERHDALRAGHLLEETSLIEQRQASWHELNFWYATLYTNRELPAFRWGEIEGAETELWPANLRTENIISEIGEAMLSKASSSPLKPTPVPHGQSYKVERAVRLLDQFILGVWRQTKAEDAAVQAFRDAYMSGIGCVRVVYDRDKKTLHVEPVFFDSVIIDNRECAGRKAPRVVRIREVLPREHVLARYGCEALGEQKTYHPQRNVAKDWVVVVTAYRLPDHKGKGGRITTVCCDKVLEDIPWEHDWLPLVFFHWKDRTDGFFVPSGVEEVVPFQVRLNELNEDIKDAQDLTCRPRMAVNANSQINIDEWENSAGRFLMWSGDKPEPLVWATDLATLLNERERTRSSGFSHMGVSEMFANADLPQATRMDSSAAVREVRNMEDGRHLRLWTNFEAFRLGIARAILNVLSVSKGAKAYSAVYHPGAAKASAKTIPYEAVRVLTEDQFSWTMEATPLSMMSPAARRELLRDWTSRGLVQEGSDEARRMEGNPNLERIEDLELAAADDILRHLGILEDGGYEAPTELTNCTLGIKKVTANYHRLKNYEDVPDEVLQAHIKWVVAAVSIQQQAIQPQGPTMPFAPTQGMPGTNAAQAPRTLIQNNGGM